MSNKKDELDEVGHFAYDIRYSLKRKVYYIVKVKYTKADIIEKTVAGDSRIVALMNAKKAIVQKVLSINIDPPVEIKEEEK